MTTPPDRPPGHVDAITAAVTPEPPPTKGEGDVWAEIIETLPAGPLREACVARRQMGLDKYGQPLQRGDGRSHAVDEAQEYLDAAAYRAARLGAHDERVGVLLRWAGECLGLDVDPDVVQVVRHRDSGELVLVLTDREGAPCPIVPSKITYIEPSNVGGAWVFCGGSCWAVLENFGAIADTLERLKAERGE